MPVNNNTRKMYNKITFVRFYLFNTDLIRIFFTYILPTLHTIKYNNATQSSILTEFISHEGYGILGEGMINQCLFTLALRQLSYFTTWHETRS